MQSEAGVLRCPSCGAPCSPEARACPHCDVELASVRCAHCFALHFVGSQFCARCGKALAPEPLLEILDATCPRCARPLHSAAGEGDDEGRKVYECTGCGGLFVDKLTLEHIIASEAPRVEGVVRGAHEPPASTSRVPEQIHYVKCPACQVVMNRVNFGRRSGVVVDVCKQHGTWFDAGELTTAIEFVTSGGYGESKRLEAAELAREKAPPAPALYDTAESAPEPGWWGVRSSVPGGTRYQRLLDVLLQLLR